MTRVAILCFEGTYLSCAAGFADLLQVANVHLRDAWASAFSPFEWSFLSEDGARVAASSGLTIETQRLDNSGRHDAVLIPALHYPGYKRFARFLDDRSSVYAWLRAQWQSGAWIGANCTGTFLLAQSGLLDGRAATTTWWLDRAFRSRYPRVNLHYRSVLTEVDRLLCAGATATTMLQAIRIIQQFTGRDLASRCARAMLIDISHTGQIPYVPLLTEPAHQDALVDRAQHWLAANMAKEVSIRVLAGEMAVSERTLVRRFGAALGQTPLEYLQAVRLRAARALLESGDMPVQSIAGQVGYADASSFSRLFRAEVGLTPGDYRRRFKSLPAAGPQAGA
jgi:transcriptional regulator GlxA family with amidase domain